MRFRPENRSEELVKGSGELGGLLGGRRLGRLRWEGIRQMGHGEASGWWDYGGVELAFEGFELEGIVEWTVAVPYSGFCFFFLFGFVPLPFPGFLHVWKLWRNKEREREMWRCFYFFSVLLFVVHSSFQAFCSGWWKMKRVVL